MTVPEGETSLIPVRGKLKGSDYLLSFQILKDDASQEKRAQRPVLRVMVNQEESTPVNVGVEERTEELIWIPIIVDPEKKLTIRFAAEHADFRLSSVSLRKVGGIIRTRVALEHNSETPDFDVDVTKPVTLSTEPINLETIIQDGPSVRVGG